MTHPSIHQTELAAALFDLVGGPVPHPYEQEEEARALAKQLGDRSKVLLKVIELCKTPTTPEQLYLTARAYSFLGARMQKRRSAMQLPICPQTVGRGYRSELLRKKEF